MAEYQRATAYKFRIGELLKGQPVMDGERFGLLDLEDKKVIRINVIGNIVEKFESEGERKFAAITLDDASGQIKVRVFGDDVGKLKDFGQGDTVLIIGMLRYFSGELYILPEIMKKKEPNYLLIRKLEREKVKPVLKAEIKDSRQKILDRIKNSEEEQGIEVEKLIIELNEIPADIINNDITKLLEEGVIYEPRPGKVRWLG
jgi:RPA family protein